MSKIFNQKSKLLLTAVIPLALIMALSIGSYATSVGVTSSSVQGLAGIQYNVAGGFSVTSHQFTLTQTGSAATSSPTWTNAGTAKTLTTTGNWQFQITVSASTLADASHTVTVQWNLGSGYVTLGTITFTGATTSGDTMTFVFDAGTGPNAGNTAIIVTIT